MNSGTWNRINPGVVLAAMMTAGTLGTACSGGSGGAVMDQVPRFTDVLSLEGAKKAVRDKLAGKLSEAVLQGNLDAIERAYQEVNEG